MIGAESQLAAMTIEERQDVDRRLTRLEELMPALERAVDAHLERRRREREQ